MIGSLIVDPLIRPRDEYANVWPDAGSNTSRWYPFPPTQFDPWETKRFQVTVWPPATDSNTAHMIRSFNIQSVCLDLKSYRVSVCVCTARPRPVPHLPGVSSAQDGVGCRDVIVARA